MTHRRMRTRTRTLRRTLTVLAALGVPAVRVDAQRLAPVPFDDWRTAWSPLALASADPAPLGPWLSPLPDLLLRAAPRVGLAWSQGHVSALALDARDASTQFALQQDAVAGDYRRALDPAKVRATGLSAIGWRAIGTGASDSVRVASPDRAFTLIGRVHFASRQAQAGTFALGAAALGGSPLVSVDTSTPDLAHTRALLEGAAGVRRGAWLGGIAAGLDVGEIAAERSRVARGTRASAPGVSVGVGRTFASERLVLSGQARWLGRTETLQANTNPGLSTIYELEGFGDPVPLDLRPIAPYYRRIVRDARSWSLAAGGHAWATAWSVGVERSTLEEGQWSRRANDPPKDRWSVTGGAVTAVAQRRVPRLGLVTVDARTATASGDANRAELRGTVLAQERSAWHVGTELRRTGAPAAATWAWALGGRLGGATDARRDGLLRVESDLQAFHSAAWGEVARQVDARHAVALAVGASGYAPSGSIPEGTTLGPVAQQLVAPSLEHEAGGAVGMQGALTLRRQLAAGRPALAWLRLGMERVRPTGSEVTFRPRGDRTMGQLVLGVTMR